MALNAVGWKIAYSLTKQSDALTPCDAAKIINMRDQEDFAPVTMERLMRAGDRQHFGKGNQLAEYDITTQKIFNINAQTRPATDLDLAFAFAFVLGAVNSAQPDALGDPNTWAHTFTWQNIGGTTTERPYCTIIEEFGGGTTPGYRRKLIGVTIDQLTLRGQMGQLVRLSFQGRSRAYAVEATATLPTAVTPASHFLVQRALLKFGPNPASTIAAKWVSFEISLNANTDPKFRAGTTAALALLANRFDTQMQDQSGNIVVELDDTFRGYFENETDNLELELLLSSNDQVDGADKTFLLTIPRLKIASEAFSLENRTVIYTLTFDVDSVLKPASGEIISAVLTSDIDDTDLFVENP